ncbi:MAG: hypothetical protein LBF61_12480 [Azoarcus sp.]|jgi:prophage antirepressor-like protein|nr:hypothetical protein [Azoarcus sp.]
MATIATPGASAPAIFNFNSHSVRIVVRDDAPWFVASDVAEALEYRNAPDMTRFLDEDEAATHNVRSRSENGVEQDREVLIISESGMYHAVLKSRKPAAKAFRHWVTGEVLPAIRKTGCYNQPTASLKPLIDHTLRYLVWFDDKGEQQHKPIAPGACVMSVQQMLKAINEPNGLIVNTNTLADFAVAVIRRLQARCEAYQEAGRRLSQKQASA